MKLHHVRITDYFYFCSEIYLVNVSKGIDVYIGEVHDHAIVEDYGGSGASLRSDTELSECSPGSPSTAVMVRVTRGSCRLRSTALPFDESIARGQSEPQRVRHSCFGRSGVDEFVRSTRR